ncbi:MAG: enoyl-CoA hydratase/isomerase family protein [Gammaproteobacteria bacterium]|nr:enoyl-CoA hydratase/isomerase family protein [Gammaproteobacteria bacterium]
MSTTRLIEYQVVDRVALISMGRAPVNAINHQLIEELLDAYRRADADEGARAIILTSAFDKSFSAGMDLAMIRGKTGLDLRRYLEKLYYAMHDLQYRMRKPTIAAVNGPARAAGVTLAVSCDVIIAADDVDFSYPEINVGVLPAMHYVHLPRQIGRHVAFELLFTGEPITAVDAAARGLINRAVPRGEVLEQALVMGRKFATKSPTIMQMARGSFMRANDSEYRRNIENQVETICNVIDTEDAQEGLNAFVEKRAPNWA